MVLTKTKARIVKNLMGVSPEHLLIHSDGVSIDDFLEFDDSLSEVKTDLKGADAVVSAAVIAQ